MKVFEITQHVIVDDDVAITVSDFKLSIDNEGEVRTGRDGSGFLSQFILQEYGKKIIHINGEKMDNRMKNLKVIND